MDTPQPPNSDPNWERKTLEKLAFAALDEQRARRRWGIAFKLLGFMYLVAVLIAVVDWGTGAEHQERHTAMVNLIGVIEAKGGGTGGTRLVLEGGIEVPASDVTALREPRG